MTPFGKCFDIGNATASSISAWRKGYPISECGAREDLDNGNGALMRIAPIALLNINNQNSTSRLSKTILYSSLTHAHPRSLIACIIYTEFLLQLYMCQDKMKAMSAIKKFCHDHSQNILHKAEWSHYNRILDDNIWELNSDEIKSGGYVVHTLEAAMWCLFKHHNFKDTVLEAVNLGEDTDTTGIVAGSMAGMLYGFDAIPADWVNTLKKIEMIKGLCGKFAECLL